MSKEKSATQESSNKGLYDIFPSENSKLTSFSKFFETQTQLMTECRPDWPKDIIEAIADYTVFLAPTSIKNPMRLKGIFNNQHSMTAHFVLRDDFSIDTRFSEVAVTDSLILQVSHGRWDPVEGSLVFRVGEGENWYSVMPPYFNCKMTVDGFKDEPKCNNHLIMKQDRSSRSYTSVLYMQ